MSKLAITAETEEDRFDLTTKVLCYACPDEDVEKSPGKLSNIVDAIMKAPTFSRQEEIKAWEQEFVACEHTVCLQQDATRHIKTEGTGFLELLNTDGRSAKRVSRSITMLRMRPEGEPLALSAMRQYWLWPKSIWRHRR